MRKIGIVAVIVLACSFVSVAEAQKVCASVHLGGADIALDGEQVPPNNDANLSLGAILKCDGSVRGQAQDTWAGIGPVHGTVTCLVVEGNNAWVSGVIKNENTADEDADLDEGYGFFIRLQDNGKNNKHADQPDMASFFYTDPDPAFFELLCYAMLEVPLYELNNGQLTIKER